MLPTTGFSEQVKKFHNYDVHYSVFNSTFITPQIAKAYNLKRATNRAYINIGFAKIRALGTIHNIADAVKLMFKEDIIPGGVHRAYYLLAPILASVVAFTTFAVIPFASPDLFVDVGLPGPWPPVGLQSHSARLPLVSIRRREP